MSSERPPLYRYESQYQAEQDAVEFSRMYRHEDKPMFIQQRLSYMEDGGKYELSTTFNTAFKVVAICLNGRLFKEQ